MANKSLNFKTILIRVGMGVLLTVLIFVAIEAPPFVYYLLTSLIIIIGVTEFFLMFPQRFRSGYYFLSLVLALFFPAYFYFHFLWSQIPYPIIILISLILIAHRVVMDSDPTALKILRFGNSIAAVFFIGLLFSYQMNIRIYDGGGRIAKDLLIYFYIVNIAGDTSAYFIGSKFGKHRLAPSISPGKTVEGSLAALVGNLIAATGCLLFYRYILSREFLSLFGTLLGAALIGVTAQVGDLLESLFKRSAGVKDASALLAGHGGVLDRIDSFILSSPVFFIAIDYLRRI